MIEGKARAGLVAISLNESNGNPSELRELKGRVVCPSSLEAMMKSNRVPIQLVLIVCLAVMAIGVSAGAAGASTIYLCINENANGAVTSGGTVSGLCNAGYDQVALPATEGEQQKLLEILPHLNYEEKGIDSKPTIRITGVNVQLLSGAGTESEINGEGNLIIGYDAFPREQTGSNNLILGSSGQKYTSFGSFLAGEKIPSATRTQRSLVVPATRQVTLMPPSAAAPKTSRAESIPR